MSNERTRRRAGTFKTIGIIASAAGVILGGAGAGYAAVSSAHPSVPATAQVPAVHSAADMTYPLDKYGYPDAKMPVILHARRVFEERCMRRLGFDPAQSPHTRDDVSPSSGSQLLTYLSIDDARRHGYQTSDAASLTQTARPQENSVPVSADVARLKFEAFTGKTATGAVASKVNGRTVPSGGCLREGDRELKKGAGELPVDPRFLSEQAQFKTAKDSRMIPVLQEWSKCMRRFGFSYNAPWAAAIPQSRQEAQPTSREINTATADATCRERTNVASMWVAIERGYQQQLIGQHKTDLARANKVLAVWLKNAERVSTTPVG